ncbi:type II secretion system protein J [Chloroflexota bacterium]
MRIFSISKVFSCRESGMTLLETVVALAILGTIAVTFLGGLVTTSKAVLTVDERATVESLAQSQMEWAQSANYIDDATEYSPAPISTGMDYINYSANITVEPLHPGDDGIQKITVTVKRSGEQVFTLESYKIEK